MLNRHQSRGDCSLYWYWWDCWPCHCINFLFVMQNYGSTIFIMFCLVQPRKISCIKTFLGEFKLYILRLIVLRQTFSIAKKIHWTTEWRETIRLHGSDRMVLGFKYCVAILQQVDIIVRHLYMFHMKLKFPKWKYTEVISWPILLNLHTQIELFWSFSS